MLSDYESIRQEEEQYLFSSLPVQPIQPVPDRYEFIAGEYEPVNYTVYKSDIKKAVRIEKI